MTPLAKRLKEKANKPSNYSKGYDVFVECYDDEQYEDLVEGLATWKEVMEVVKSIISYRREIESTAF